MSSTDEDEIDPKYGVNLKLYEILSPAVVGHQFRTHTNEQCHVLKLEAPPAPMERMVKESKRAYERANAKYQAEQRSRLILDCLPKHMDRFEINPAGFEYFIVQKIDGTPFTKFAERIHNGSKSRWSVQAFMNRNRLPGHSLMIVHFETAEDATVFKIFQR